MFTILVNDLHYDNKKKRWVTDVSFTEKFLTQKEKDEFLKKLELPSTDKTINQPLHIRYEGVRPGEKDEPYNYYRDIIIEDRRPTKK